MAPKNCNSLCLEGTDHKHCFHERLKEKKVLKESNLFEKTIKSGSILPKRLSRFLTLQRIQEKRKRD